MFVVPEAPPERVAMGRGFHQQCLGGGVNEMGIALGPG